MLTVDDARAMIDNGSDFVDEEQFGESLGDEASQAGTQAGVSQAGASQAGTPQPGMPQTEAPQAGASSAEEAPSTSGALDGNVGLGIDVVEIARMEALLQRSAAFAPRVFSEAERAYCESKANPAAHYATRFAAKEAVVKALGTGFISGIDVRDIEVVRNAAGKPSAKLTGRAAEVAAELGVRELSISLTYTHLEAVACAMAITEASVRATEARKDPMEELAKQFKELRGVLDEL